jgi:nicotine blue oxidoreductase
MGRVAAIVLAAGEASRFGSPKQQLLLPAVLERLVRTAIDEIVVVQGAHRLESPSNSLLQGIPARVVHCKEWELGPGASLRCGLSVLGEDIDAAVVVLADGPNLAAATVERVLETWRERGGAVAASYGGDRGHPLVVGRSEWTDVPDDGLRDRPVSLVPCDDLAAPGDIDTPEDLAAL